MGTVSGQFKMFMDKTSGRWFDRKWQDKISGGFTNSGSLSGDKLGTLSALSLFAAQHGMIWVGPAEICSTFDPQPSDINRLGSQLGIMAQCNPYAPAEESPPAGDKETARLFGIRIAKITKVWAKNRIVEEEPCTL
jgi:multimeric flavodoxin WrbA